MRKWACPDSNQKPIGYEPTALPLSYRPSYLRLRKSNIVNRKSRAADGIRTRDNSLEGCCVTPTPLPHVGGQ